MNEQTESGEETPQGKAPEEAPSTTVKSLYFLIGFLGWFLVNALIYLQKFDQESLTICGGLLFPVNLVLLVILLRKRPLVGWGMLSALGVNLVISLVFGVWNNALCFLPFFAR
jgi:hypothetical protein